MQMGLVIRTHECVGFIFRLLTLLPRVLANFCIRLISDADSDSSEVFGSLTMLAAKLNDSIKYTYLFLSERLNDRMTE